MTETDASLLVNNELRRLQIQKHVHFSDWYQSLGPYSRQIFEMLMESDVTVELISLAQEAPDEEWQDFQFLRVIGGGNPDPQIMPILTNYALRDIQYFLERFKPK